MVIYWTRNSLPFIGSNDLILFDRHITQIFHLFNSFVMNVSIRFVVQFIKSLFKKLVNVFRRHLNEIKQWFKEWFDLFLSSKVSKAFILSLHSLYSLHWIAIKIFLGLRIRISDDFNDQHIYDLFVSSLLFCLEIYTIF